MNAEVRSDARPGFLSARSGGVRNVPHRMSVAVPNRRELKHPYRPLTLRGRQHSFSDATQHNEDAMANSAKATVEEFFRRNASGDPPEHIAELVREDVDWYVAGDVHVVPWIGRKEGRAGVADFYRELRQQVIAEKFEITDMLATENRVVVLGELASRVRNTGKLIETEFAFDFTVEDGQIVRFRLFEDSHAVALAAV